MLRAIFKVLEEKLMIKRFFWGMGVFYYSWHGFNGRRFFSHIDTESWKNFISHMKASYTVCISWQSQKQDRFYEKKFVRDLQQKGFAFWLQELKLARNWNLQWNLSAWQVIIVLDASHDRTSNYWQEMHQMIIMTRSAISNIMKKFFFGDNNEWCRKRLPTW